MANNRMYLVCRVCNPDGEERIEDSFRFAKYYPNTGWYTTFIGREDGKLLSDQLDEFFDKHQHEPTMWGHGFRLVYEIAKESSSAS